MLTEKDWWTIKAMETYGGSFVKALAQACWHADPANLRKIKNTFGLYWGQYTHTGWLMQIDHEKGIKRVVGAPDAHRISTPDDAHDHPHEV